MATYTESMIAAMRDAAPLNMAKATDLASEFGVSYRSVIAKASQLGIEYQKKAPAAKREKGVTKADIVASIRQKVGLPEVESVNLTLAELEKVLKALS